MIRLSVHPNRQRLPAPNEDTGAICARAATGWRVQEFDVKSLAAHLDRGASIAAVFSDGHARKDSFIESSVLVFDCDEPGEFDALRSSSWIQQYQRIEGETKRSTPDHVRGRVIVFLAEPLTGAAVFIDRADRVLYRLECDGIFLKDRSTTEAHKAFFGFKRGTTRITAGRLVTLDELDKLPTRPAQAARKQVTPRYEATTGDLDQKVGAWIRDEVMSQLEIVAPIAKGREFRHCPNPHHDDQHASFRISFDKNPQGYPVCSCNVQYEPRAWSKVAEWVGARSFWQWMKDQQPPRTMAHRNPMKQAQPVEAAQPIEATDRRTTAAGWLATTFTRELLNFKKYAAVVPTLSMINRAAAAGALDTSAITRADVIEAARVIGAGFSTRTIYEAIDLLLEMGFLRSFPTINDKESVGKYRKNFPTSGRTADLLALVSLDEQKQIIERLAHPRAKQRAFRVIPRGDRAPVLANVDQDMIASLPGVTDDRAASLAARIEKARQPAYLKQVEPRRRASWYMRKQIEELRERLDDETALPLDPAFGLHTLKGYRAAFLHALKTHVWGEKKVSLKEAADATGLSQRAVSSYWHAAGFTSEASEPVSAELVIERDQPVTQAIRALAMTVKGRPMNVKSVDPETGELETFSYASDDQHDRVSHRIETAIASGRRVILDFNVANTQKPIVDFVPGQNTVKRSAPPESRRSGEVISFTPSPSAAAPAPSADTVHSPEWVTGQLRLGFTVMGWTTPRGEFINPNTGLVLPPDAPGIELAELFVGDVPESLKRQRRQRARQRENAMPLNEYRAHMLAILSGSGRAS